MDHETALNTRSRLVRVRKWNFLKSEKEMQKSYRCEYEKFHEFLKSILSLISRSPSWRNSPITIYEKDTHFERPSIDHVTKLKDKGKI